MTDPDPITALAKTFPVMIVNTPYPGQREPSCIHSDGKQPASMCLECRTDPYVRAWHEASGHYARTGEVLTRDEFQALARKWGSL